MGPQGDAFKEKKGNHGKFDALWTGPFVITQAHTKNTFVLHNMDGECVFDGPINGHFLKLYFVEGCKGLSFVNMFLS